MPKSPTYTVYRKHAEKLHDLLSAADISFEPYREWKRLHEIIRVARPASGQVSDGLLSGPFRKLLDLGLIALLADVMEDDHVLLVPDDIIPSPLRSAVSSEAYVFDAGIIMRSLARVPCSL